jgi:thiol-disulfide isomerase/thioredoxin
MISGSKTQFVLIVSVCAAIVAAMGNVSAQDLDPINWKIKSEILPPQINAGSKFDVQVVAKIDAGWHLYSPEQPAGGPIPTRITLPENQKFKVAGELESPPSQVVFDTNFNVDTQFYEDEAIFTLPVEAAKDVLPGKQTLTVSAFFQTCNETKCLPPKAVKLTAEIQIGQVAQSPNNTPYKPRNQPDKTQNTGRTETDQAAPRVDFGFVDFSGRLRKFSEFRGKYVLLDFWATWCKPCLADIPKLKELYEKHKGDGFEIIGMDAETIGDDAESPDPKFAEETAARAKQIVATRGVTWTQATAGSAVPVAMKLFNIKFLPRKILIDREGKVIATIGEKDDLKGILEKTFSEKR